MVDGSTLDSCGWMAVGERLDLWEYRKRFVDDCG